MSESSCATLTFLGFLVELLARPVSEAGLPSDPAEVLAASWLALEPLRVETGGAGEELVRGEGEAAGMEMEPLPPPEPEVVRMGGGVLDL